LRVDRCLDLRSVWQQLPISCCICFSKLCLVIALGRLDAGTVRVFTQSSIPLVGLGSAIFLQRRYSVQQWCSLTAISLALIAFYFVKAEVEETKHAQPHNLECRSFDSSGVFLILSSIAFNLLGAVLMETFLKGHCGRLHEQKVHLLIGEVAVNTLLIFIVPLLHSDPLLRAEQSPWHRGFFAGWDHRVLICAIVWIPAGWTATMLVKRCSNLLKTIAQATSSVLTYVFSVAPVTLVGPPLTPEPMSWPVISLAIAVMFSALTFGTDSRPSSGDKERRRMSASSCPRRSSTTAGKASQAEWSSAYVQPLQNTSKVREQSGDG